MKKFKSYQIITYLLLCLFLITLLLPLTYLMARWNFDVNLYVLIILMIIVPTVCIYILIMPKGTTYIDDKEVMCKTMFGSIKIPSNEAKIKYTKFRIVFYNNKYKIAIFNTKANKNFIEETLSNNLNLGKPKSPIKPRIKIIKRLDKEENWYSDAILIYVENGMGKLKYKKRKHNMDYDYQSIDLLLNDKPLTRCRFACYPTSASMLATGYGRDKIDFDELLKIEELLNNDFEGLENSINIMEPILSLLESGYYVIADVLAYPTDGEGNFFWNANNEFQDKLATAMAVIKKYSYIDGAPLYLYPSQSSESFSEERLEYYLSKNSNNYPRAIAYYITEYMSVLLDGHHKATAKALNGEPINTIAIIPGDKRTISDTYFSRIKISNLSYLAQNPNKSIRETESYKSEGYKNEDCFNSFFLKYPYSKYISIYPSLESTAENLDCNILKVEDEIMEKSLNNLNEDSIIYLKAALRKLLIDKDQRLKKWAIICGSITKEQNKYLFQEYREVRKLRITAFTVLSQINNDVDITQYFIDYLVNEGEDNELKAIADDYLAMK